MGGRSAASPLGTHPREARMIAAALGALLIFAALLDTFEAVVLPRRIARRFRLARMYYLSMWRLWRLASDVLTRGRDRQNFLGMFGPLSMLGLFALWAVLMIVGFALIHWGAGTMADGEGDFAQCLYLSGETFFTLGYGDVTPEAYGGKLLSVVEAGTGFGFMAVVIGYLPVLYQAFSRRERNIALLDARAGSPPTAGELMRRAAQRDARHETERFLNEWELWSAELLESHISFPVLSYFRSQHNNQSWLAALAVVLDASSILLVAGGSGVRRRAELTFAMARHACVDLCLVFWLPPREPDEPRLTPEEAQAMLGLVVEDATERGEAVTRLASLRELYEPFLAALSAHFRFVVPRFVPEKVVTDNWQTSPWTSRAPGLTDLPGAASEEEHF